MLKLGLTGSIATGKSTVLKTFAELGVPVFSADDVVHELYRAEAVAPIEAAFPGTTQHGEVDRAALSRVLSEPGRLKQLEAIVHPLVRARVQKFLTTAEAAGEPLAVVDVPLLFETGFDYGLDKVAVTTVDEATQRQRAMEREGMSVEKLGAILARQLPQAEKLKRADYVFDTSGSLADTRNAVAALVEQLTAQEIR